VLERTAQLEAANRELEAFSYSISHDLRAPLRSIDGFSKALLEDYLAKLGDEGKDFLQRIRNASQRMGELIDDLLALARVTRSEMVRVPVDLSMIGGKIIEELRRSDPQRILEIAITPGMITNADPNLMRLLLENLLDNAWKFTSCRKLAKIELGMAEKDGQKVYFVRDNGAGFDMAYADKLFGAFQRLHSAQEFPGTGIGLATVNRIVLRHGGKAWAEGKVDAGATVFFVLG
jgi:light-regulated signal transduction histidine kinase (bacteriophytochrome)